VSGGNIVFKVKSIPGLKYQVLASDSLAPDSFTPAGKGHGATGPRQELTVTRLGETRGFFKIQVSR